MCHVYAQFDARKELASVVKAILALSPGAITHAHQVGMSLFFAIRDDATAAKLNTKEIAYGRGKRTTLRILGLSKLLHLNRP